MNNTMGHYIDGLTDEQRDHLIVAPKFLGDASWWDGTCGCLCGTVLRRHPKAMEVSALCWTDFAAWEQQQSGACWANAGPAIRFPRALDRFGHARITRAVKLRAARRNSVLGAPEEVMVLHG